MGLASPRHFLTTGPNVGHEPQGCEIEPPVREGGPRCWESGLLVYSVGDRAALRSLKGNEWAYAVERFGRQELKRGDPLGGLLQ